MPLPIPDTRFDKTHVRLVIASGNSSVVTANDPTLAVTSEARATKSGLHTWRVHIRLSPIRFQRGQTGLLFEYFIYVTVHILPILIEAPSLCYFVAQ
jgi:hypothetical protein